MVVPNTNIKPYLSSVLNTSQVAEIQELTEKYPWCPAYRILLAKAMSDTQSKRREEALHLAALYTGNRSKLFDLLHADISQPAEIQVAEAEQIPVAKENALREKETPVVAIEAEEKVVEEVSSAEHEDQQSPRIAEIAFKGFKIDGNIEPAETPAEERSAAGGDEGASSESEVTKVDFDKIITYDPTVELEPIQKEEEVRVQIPFDTVVYNPEVELNKLVKEAGEEEEDHDFVYWLDHLKPEKAEREVPEQSPSTSVDEVSVLLEKFLETKRSKPKIKREFFNPEVKAEQSEMDDSEVVSESLAKLYVKQELYQKALETYRKLSLQNPDKSATFAALIKELEEKIKLNKD